MVETFYIASRAPVDSSSSAPSTSVQHDESMLRYVLGEAISGTSGNENWPADFRANASPLIPSLHHSLTIVAIQNPTTALPTKSDP